MKRYIKQTTNTIHYIADLRREFSNMSIPEDTDCSELGYEFLVETIAPVQEGFYAVEVEPVNYTQTWELRPEVVQVPQSISARQARLVLLSQNLLDSVEVVLASNRAWQIEWEYASEIERTHALIEAMQQALDLTDEQVDGLFINGAKL